jgi:hypothetical protein
VSLPEAVATYERAAATPALTDVESIAARYDVPPDKVKVFRLPDLHAIKISFPRPSTQGGAHDHDMHSSCTRSPSGRRL